MSVYINARLPQNVFRVVKPKEQLSTLPEDSCDIFVENISTYYMKRPNTCMFNSMSIASFACKYVVFQPKSTDNINTQSGMQRFKLQDSSKWIRQRTKPACLRTNHTSLVKNEDEFYYGLLYLFVPWRNTYELLVPWKTLKDAFVNYSNRMDMETAQYLNMADKLTKAINQLCRNSTQNDFEHIQSVYAPNTVHDDLQDKINGAVSADCEDFAYDIAADSTNNDESKSDNFTSEYIKTLAVYTMTDEEFIENVQRMSETQHGVFKVVTRTFDRDSVQLKLFISGGAGTGKSILLRLIREAILRANKSNLPNVLVAAPTGVAAHNIRGVTIHKMLNLPVQHKKKCRVYTFKFICIAEDEELV